MCSAKANKVVFLDRDGTINIDYGYVSSPRDIDLIAGSGQAIANFYQLNFNIVVVTNQSSVGRKMATRDDVISCNSELCNKLVNENASALIDLFLVCYDSPDAACECRKPKIGLLKSLPREWNISYQDSWVIGDKLTDINFGLNAGIPLEHCLLVLTGRGIKSLECWNRDQPLLAFDNILTASQYITQEVSS